MKKNRVWQLLCSVCLFVVLLFAFGACGKDEKKASVQLSDSAITLDVTETYVLTANLENASGPVVWSVSDESIASVTQDGTVTGIREGVATVTAAVGDVFANCTVNVYDSGYLPALTVNSKAVSLALDDSYVLIPTVTLGTKPIADEIVYDWGFAIGANEEVLSIQTQADGSAVITGLTEGDTELIVSTTVRTRLLAQKVKVSVYSDGVVVAVTNLSVSKGGYETELGLAKIGGYAETVQPDVIVYENGEQVENPNLIWTVADNGIVRIENGAIKAVGVGTEIVSVSYKDTEITIAVTVVKPILRVSEKLLVETYRTTSLQLETELIGTFEKATLDGAVISTAYENGSIILNKENLPSSATVMGEDRTLTIYTDKMLVETTVDVYSMVIASKQDFDEMGLAMSVVEKDRVWDGYFVLDGDIDYDGAYTGYTDYTKLKELNGAAGQHPANGNENGFKGVFDGRGYAVDGLEIGNSGKAMDSVFGVLATGSVIKNVSFTNCTLANDGALVCQGGDGRVENVYVRYTKLIRGEGQVMGTFFLRNEYVADVDENGNAVAGVYVNENHNAKVVNSFVDARGVVVEGATSGTVRLLGTNTYLQMLRNGNPDRLFNSVYLLCDNEELAQKAIGTNYYNETDCGAYLSIADLKKGNPVPFVLSNGTVSAAGSATNVQSRMAQWVGEDSVWVLCGGLPFFEKHLEQLRKEDFSIANQDTVVYTGSSYEVEILGDYVVLSLDQNSLDNGVELDGMRITVPTDATIGEITLTASSVVVPSNTKTLTISVRSVVSMELTDTVDLNLDASIINGVLTSSATAKVDISLATLNTDFGTLELVRSETGNILGAEKCSFDGTTLTVYADAFDALSVYGETRIIAIIANADDSISYEISIPLFATTKVITTAAEMDVVHANVVGEYINGYYVLGNDIDFSGVTPTMSQASAWADTKFQGTFDGKGYTIKNYTQGNGKGTQSLFGVIWNGTVKNVNFENVTINAWNTSALLAVAIRGASVVENITINNFALTTTNASGLSGILVGRLIDGAPTIKNVKVYLATTGDMAGFVNFAFGQENQSTKMTLENVAIYNVKTVKAIVKTDVTYDWSGLKMYTDNGTTEYVI